MMTAEGFEENYRLHNTDNVFDEGCQRIIYFGSDKDAAIKAAARVSLLWKEITASGLQVWNDFYLGVAKAITRGDTTFAVESGSY